jgi:hypothetical protein
MWWEGHVVYVRKNITGQTQRTGYFGDLSSDRAKVLN